MTEQETQNCYHRAAKELLRTFFTDETKVATWMETENPNFGNTKPSRLIEGGRGLYLLRWMVASLKENDPRFWGESDVEPKKSAGFKIIRADNFNRDTSSDELVAENMGPFWAESIAKLLNDEFSGDQAPTFFRVVSGDYKLYVWEP